eukprot:jgi/Ulvmu1/10482/UM064_0019.1
MSLLAHKSEFRRCQHAITCHFVPLGVQKRAQQRMIAVRSLNRREDEAEVLKSPVSSRDSIRIGIPSKGRMAEDTLSLLSACQLKCVKPNPRQYFGQITQFPEMEVWFQRASDVVRKLRTCDLDLGIVGMDMFSEFAAEDEDLVVVHDALNFGQCKLALGVPVAGAFSKVSTLEELKCMGWSEARPMRVVTGYTNIASRFFETHGFEHVSLLSADGALEAAPAMGAADIILDLVSTGVTLRENNLKTIENGNIMESEGVLVANRRSLLERPDLLPIVHELLERLEAHLVADTFYSVTTNIRSEDPQYFAAQMREKGLGGLQGPTIAKVYGESDITYAACICVRKKDLYESVKALRQLGGSGVLVSPMTYIFDEEPRRWPELLQEIGFESDPLKH